VGNPAEETCCHPNTPNLSPLRGTCQQGFLEYFQNGRKSVFKQADDEAGVHEYLENCCRTPMHHGERTLSEPGVRIWTPSSDLAPSRRRESSAAEVPGCQWDALKSL
jgi:hypothetical protein